MKWCTGDDTEDETAPIVEYILSKKDWIIWSMKARHIRVLQLTPYLKGQGVSGVSLVTSAGLWCSR